MYPLFRFLSRGVLVAGLLAGLAALSGCATQPKSRVDVAQFAAVDQPRVRQNLAVFHAVWDLVNRKHYAPEIDGVDWEPLGAEYGPRAAAAPDERTLFRTLNEMLAPLHDSHTRVLTPAQAVERRTRERARTGLYMTRIEDQWVVTDVVPGSPADRAGVRPGWILARRNGQPVDPSEDFRPREGDPVRLEFLDLQDRPVELTLSATPLSTAPQQVVRRLEHGIVYLRFDEFDVKDRHWVRRQLKEHASAPGVIIDLRRNPGGDVLSLRITIGQFFAQPVSCGTFVSRNGSRMIRHSFQFGSARYGGRVVVLVDANSASSSEIFAAVLKDQQRAVIVGRKTAGAVLGSWFYRLPGGGLLQLSREDYIAPNGRRIETNGVEPDVVVTRTLADVRAGIDRDMETAMAVLRDQAPVRQGL